MWHTVHGQTYFTNPVFNVFLLNRDIVAGEELFLHYGYDPRNCPSWYRWVSIVFQWYREFILVQIYLKQVHMQFPPTEYIQYQGFSGHFSGTEP